MKHLLPKILLLIIMGACGSARAQTNMTIGTGKLLGNAGGLTIGAEVQSPAAKETPLQIVCIFQYTVDDITTSPPALPAKVNGMVHVDEALNGLITQLRKSGRFTGRALETLLIIPPPGSMPAQRLLLIGLGDRNTFTPQLMTDVGRTGMREALALGVTSYAHASDLKDAGIDSPTGQVAVNVVKGAIDAYQTALFLNSQHNAPVPSVTGLTLLAGPAFFVTTGDAVQAYLKQLQPQ